MITATTTDTTTTFPARPDVSESFARTVDASLATVEAAVARLDLIGPLVDGLIAIGLGDHIVTPCPNGLVWRFDPSAQGRVGSPGRSRPRPRRTRRRWSRSASASPRATTARASVCSRRGPVLGPIVELHAHRILRSVDALAEESEDDPFDAPADQAPRLRARPVGSTDRCARVESAWRPSRSRSSVVTWSRTSALRRVRAPRAPPTSLPPSGASAACSSTRSRPSIAPTA